MNQKTVWTIVVVAVVVVGAMLIFSNKKAAAPVGNNNQQASDSTAAVPNPCANSADKDVVMVGKSDPLGNYLTDSKCMTLYVFAEDKSGVSTCTDTCAQNWPPFAYDNKDLKTLTTDLTKRLNIIKRKDGSYQYAYGNTPLYYYAGDKVAGDTKGNGMNSGAWSVLLVDKQGTK